MKASDTREIIKSLLRFLGLYTYARQLKKYPKRLTDWLHRRKFSSIRIFEASIGGLNVQFCIEDAYSSSWFFPRYEGGKIHERQVTEMILSSLKEDGCFVDVGANLGWYTCIACKSMLKGVVYAFEMDDLNYALLQKNISINSCKNVETYNLAVSDSAGEMSYLREREVPSAGFRFSSSNEETRSERLVSVRTIALDDLFQEDKPRPDVIKIDVEGAELHVLRGMRRTIQEDKPILFVEIHPPQLHIYNFSADEVLSLLIDSGYKVFEIEDMRSQTNKKLTMLSKASKLERNTMVYAVAAE
jgi:FkbM family methyltransferase